MTLYGRMMLQFIRVTGYGGVCGGVVEAPSYEVEGPGFDSLYVHGNF